MSTVFVYAESSEGNFKKSTFEAISYGREIAEIIGGKVIAAVIGDANAASLGEHGAHEVIHIPFTGAFTGDAYTNLLTEAAKQCSASIVILSNTYSGKSIAPRLSVTLDGSLATNVVSLPNTNNGFTVKRSVFSGKAFAWVSLEKSVKVIAITPNSFELKNWGGSATVNTLNATANSTISVDSVNKVTGKIPLTEAEIVVSGGRGMKGPENWGMIEELADLLGAATACSKPVSDMDWRPHSEHVGQTGITIKPNLYIAVGISGAIQHLAGVSSSKVIVAINKDPEAPFFKAADFGIVGDAFEVLPKLIAAVKQ